MHCTLTLALALALALTLTLTQTLTAVETGHAVVVDREAEEVARREVVEVRLLG